MWGAGHELNIKQEILESPEKVGQLSVGEPSYQHFFKDSPSPPPPLLQIGVNMKYMNQGMVMEGSLKFCYCWKYCKIASWEKLVDSQCRPVKREGLYLEFFSISPKPFTFVQDWKLRNCILVHFLYFHLKLWLRPVSLTLSCSLYDFASRYRIWQKL